MGFSSSQVAQAGLSLKVGGAAMGAIGAGFGAASRSSMLDFQADMADINAGLMEKNAQLEMDAGNRKIAGITLRAGQLKSSQRAAMAANGIDLGTGNAAEVTASTDIMKSIDVENARETALRSAWGYRVQGVNQTNAGLIDRASAEGISAFGAAATSLLGSAGGVADAWSAWRKTKGTGVDV